MKKFLNKDKRKSFTKGASTAFDIMGDDLELRNNDNLATSWYNVGIYFKRAINNVSKKNNYGNRYSPEELETY